MTTMFRGTLLIIGVTLLSPDHAGAQMLDLTAGSRVRLTNSFGKVRGIYEGTEAGQIKITEPDGTRRVVSLSGITRVDVSLGRTSHAGAHKGGKIGGILGLAAGTVFVLTTELNETFALPTPTSSASAGGVNLPRAVGALVGGGVVGYVVGRIVGATRKAEEWRQVYSEPPR